VSINDEKVSSAELTSIKQLPGYTVTTVPPNWNIPGDRHSRVVEVADTFIGSNRASSSHNDTYLQRFYGRITIEEVLDSIFQRTKPSSSSPSRHELSLSEGETIDDEQMQKSGIYVKSNELMQQMVQDPHEAEALLQNERLYVRCARCHQTRELAEARMQYISCKHCYTYYCSRQCREHDWSKHREVCSFSRINTLCKEVIMKVRKDPEAQFYMSKIARDGYAALGRGSVNLRINSAHTAQSYITDGWQAMANFQLNKLLHYYTIAALIAERKEPSLINLCRQYDPTDKFILSVSIIADIEQCLQTPPPEPAVIQRTLPLPQYVQQPPLISSQQSAEQENVDFTQSDEFRSAVPTEV
uniref:MYND-type domain-containing protein n=1 Tax=Elaeophora elaphi TaxID=1147741 RepID=A0A0R3S1S4_9BILA